MTDIGEMLFRIFIVLASIGALVIIFGIGALIWRDVLYHTCVSCDAAKVLLR